MDKIRMSKVVLQTSLELHTCQKGQGKESLNFSLNYYSQSHRPVATVGKLFFSIYYPSFTFHRVVR